MLLKAQGSKDHADESYAGIPYPGSFDEAAPYQHGPAPLVYPMKSLLVLELIASLSKRGPKESETNLFVSRHTLGQVSTDSSF